MNLSETCIRRPVLTTLITAAIIVLGIFAYRLLSVAALPAVDFPTISITATLPGASAETMAASVAAPIERQLSTIAGITSLTSSSSLGITSITIQFDLNRNIDGAALDVQTALSVAQRRLPVEMTTPPSFRKVNPGDFPILYISLNSPTLPLSAVNEYGEITLAQQISQLPGIAQVLIYGAQKFAVRVQVDPVAAASRNISLEDIRSVVSKTNSNTPVGTLNGPKQSVTLKASAAMTNAEEYRKVVVAYRNGMPVHLDEVARVVDSVENDKTASWFNENRAIVLAIQRQPDANTVAVVDLVRERLPQYRAMVPPSIRMEVLNDRSISIRDSVVDVQETLAIAICLVVMVIFLFLRTVSATLIPALAVPVSLIGTCAAMYVFGFSINNMTLLALTLSVGFVVDDAIVMLENIVRHIEGGMRPFEAALKGAREIGFTIVSITFSLIAVFIPVLLMGGMVGRVFREFAVTIAVAIIVSGFVSLTLTPMLCARVLRTHHEGEKQNFVLRMFEAMFKGWLRGYEWALDKVIAYKFIVLSAHVRHPGGDVLALHDHPQGLLPDRGHRLHFRIDRRRVRRFVRRRWPCCSDRSPRSSARTRRWITSIPPSGRVVRTRRSMPAACSLRSNPRRSAAKARLTSFSACGAPPTPFPAWRCISRTSRTSTSPVAFPRASSSTRCNRAIPRSCTRSRRRCATRSPRSRGCATSPPISTSRIRR